MTALGKLFRTTAFKLSFAYLVDLHHLRLRGPRLCGLERPAAAHRPVHLHHRGRDQRPGRAVPARRPAPPREHRRAALAGAGRLALSRHDAQRASASPAMSARCRRASSTGPGQFETLYNRTDETDDARPSHAIVRVYLLPGGFRLLVGRDVEERTAPARRHPPRLRLFAALHRRSRLRSAAGSSRAACSSASTT